MMMATATAVTILQLFHFVRMYFTMLAAEQPYKKDWSKRGYIKYTKLKIYGCVPKLSSKG